MGQNGKPKGLTLTPSQKEILKEVKKYILNRPEKTAESKLLDLPSTLPARDRKFVEKLADDLHVPWSTVPDEQGDRFLRLELPSNGDDDDDEEEDEEASMAVHRIIRRYENAKVQELSPEESQEEAEKKYQMKFQEWKNNYYQSKFGWGLDNDEEMKKLTENYVQGLQWVLYYYYNGIASWPWFFNYHYAPMISGWSPGVCPLYIPMLTP